MPNCSFLCWCHLLLHFVAVLLSLLLSCCSCCLPLAMGIVCLFHWQNETQINSCISNASLYALSLEIRINEKQLSFATPPHAADMLWLLWLVNFFLALRISYWNEPKCAQCLQPELLSNIISVSYALPSQPPASAPSSSSSHNRNRSPRNPIAARHFARRSQSRASLSACQQAECGAKH